MAIVRNDYAAYLKTLQGEIPLRDLDAQEKIDSLSEEISDIYQYSYQYLFETNRTDGYLWNLKSGKVTKQVYKGYCTFEPIFLRGGMTYHFVNMIFIGQSYFINSNGIVTKGNIYFENLGLPNVDRYEGDVTLKEDVAFYPTYINGDYGSGNNRSMIYTGSEPEEYVEGIYNKSINGSLKVDTLTLSQIEQKVLEDVFLGYDYSYIKNGELTCNNNNINSKNTVAKYIEADMGSTVKKIMCKVKFLGGSQAALITTKLNSNRNISNIVNSSIHVVFSATNVSVGIYISNSLEAQKISYEELDKSGETEYEIGFEFVGNNTIKVYLPNGTSQELIVDGCDDINGQYAIWEHYTYSSDITDIVTEKFNHVIFTGFYCSCDSGNELRDNFKRADGFIGNAPTGHIYKLYRNDSNTDSIYDNTNN